LEKIDENAQSFVEITHGICDDDMQETKVKAD